MNKTQEWFARNLLGFRPEDLKALTSFNIPVGGYGTSAPVQFISDESGILMQEGYGANEIVYSILMMSADKERLPPWAAYKIKDESSLKSYELEMHKVGTPEFSVKRALDFRTKALELYTRDGKLNQLLDWPNENQTFSDLVADSGISKRGTGNRYIKGTLLDMGINKGKPQELHLLPAQHVSITSSGTFPSRPLEYILQLGTQHKYTPEEIMHDRLYNPLYNLAGEDLMGLSPLKVGRKTLTRNASAKTASVKSFDNLGPENVLYTDDSRMSGEEALAQASATRQKLNELSGVRNRKKTAISAYKMGVVQLGLSPVDLAILDAEKWDVVTLANLYNFPHILLLPDHSTLNNLMVAERALTTRCALPYLVSFRNNFNRKLRTHWGYKNENIYCDFDLSVYSELQKDMKDLTTWIKDSWWLTPRMRYELQQLDIPEEIQNEPMLDKILVPSGLSEISTLNPDNLDNAIDDELDDED